MMVPLMSGQTLVKRNEQAQRCWRHTIEFLVFCSRLAVEEGEFAVEIRRGTIVGEGGGRICGDCLAAADIAVLCPKALKPLQQQSCSCKLWIFKTLLGLMRSLLAAQVARKYPAHNMV